MKRHWDVERNVKCKKAIDAMLGFIWINPTFLFWAFLLCKTVLYRSSKVKEKFVNKLKRYSCIKMICGWMLQWRTYWVDPGPLIFFLLAWWGWLRFWRNLVEKGRRQCLVRKMYKLSICNDKSHFSPRVVQVRKTFSFFHREDKKKKQFGLCD